MTTGTLTTVEQAMHRRRQEFAAGRHCAAQALRLAGSRAWAEQIGSGEAGEPRWPSGYVGSITHTRSIAMAAAIATCRAQSVGIDVERVVDRPRMERVSPIVLHPSEMRFASPRCDAETLFTLAFSSKEALFKCLYPLVKRRFDYRDAAVRAIDDAERRIELELLTDLGVGFQSGRRFSGGFDLHEGLVTTGFYLESE